MKRIASIDVTRGIVMIIMALDHVRDLLHIDSISQNPTNPTTTTALLFFTRWITHLCAPTFVFLAGVSAYLVYQRKGAPLTRTFLLTRGLILILLEFTLVNFGMFFDAGFHILMFEVIATIGFGFIILSLTLTLPVRVVAASGLLILFCHDLFALIPFGAGSVASQVITPFFSPIAYTLAPGRVFVMGYPPLPWLGILLTGFAAGKFFESAPEHRVKTFAILGGCVLVLFVALRYANVYGDPVPWSMQKDSLHTFLSFMNVTKYPPSLLFCSAMLGVMFLILAFAERIGPRLAAILSVYGQAPLFYFVVHFYLIHILLLGILFSQGFGWSDLTFASGSFGRPPGAVSGIPLAAVYGVWVGLVLIMYRPCQWFWNYKKANPHGWLRYL